MTLTRVSPLAVAVNTSSSCVPCVTGIASPEATPVSTSPIAIIPVKDGVRLTLAISVYVLFGVAEEYSAAFTVAVEPTSASATVTEKNAVKSVIVPSLGTEKAKFVRVPAGLVKSIVPPTILTPGAEEPNPTKASVPTNPPAIVVSVTGKPDA